MFTKPLRLAVTQAGVAACSAGEEGLHSRHFTARSRHAGRRRRRGDADAAA